MERADKGLAFMLQYENVAVRANARAAVKRLSGKENG